MATDIPSQVQKLEWSHCNECGRETQHNVVNQIRKTRDYDHDEYVVTIGVTWRILQCCGCQEVAMSKFEWCSEDDPGYSPVRTYFPPRVSRRKPDWLVRQEVPQYQGLLDEVYLALHADSRRLAMMGARTIIDKAIASKVGDLGTFAKGLNELEEANLLTPQDRRIIEVAFDAGSAAAHRGHQPSPESLNTTIDIVERLIHAEILAEKAKKLAAATPPRRTPDVPATKAKKH
ncbi:DUF4145 domain-containing protein [Ralstonia pseudosolanacearum]|uniref:DUF4145 domain-containing protein n=1 Tax=Ralstonia pseudosolanacearum TaxID=1310165 RepID=UPI001E5F5F4B|nr:DUF4145 domain-containing protein [Ralstonia pseudosolanacearum]UWD92024.1 DUF4145 domain-containing protein [Ralstonia pseudosolanacearum]CAH0443560.1 hypothetical protein LMG9673_04067 [Ralstonia pseudosolanacearum]